MNSEKIIFQMPRFVYLTAIKSTAARETDNISILGFVLKGFFSTSGFILYSTCSLEIFFYIAY